MSQTKCMKTVLTTYKKGKKVVPYRTYRTLYAPQLSYGCLKWEGGKKKEKKAKQKQKDDSLVEKQCIFKASNVKKKQKNKKNLCSVYTV